MENTAGGYPVTRYPGYLTFLPTSESRDTKTRSNIKNPAQSNLYIVP